MINNDNSSTPPSNLPASPLDKAVASEPAFNAEVTKKIHTLNTKGQIDFKSKEASQDQSSKVSQDLSSNTITTNVPQTKTTSKMNRISQAITPTGTEKQDDKAISNLPRSADNALILGIGKIFVTPTTDSNKENPNVVNATPIKAELSTEDVKKQITSLSDQIKDLERQETEAWENMPKGHTKEEANTVHIIEGKNAVYTTLSDIKSKADKLKNEIVTVQYKVKNKELKGKLSGLILDCDRLILQNDSAYSKIKSIPIQKRSIFQLSKLNQSAKTAIKSYEGSSKVNQILKNETIEYQKITSQSNYESINVPSEMAKGFKDYRFEINGEPLNEKNGDKLEDEDKDFNLAKRMEKEVGGETNLKKIAPLFTQEIFTDVTQKLSSLGLGNPVSVDAQDLIPKNLTTDKKEKLKNEIENETFPRYNIHKKSNGDLVIVSSMIVKFSPDKEKNVDLKATKKDANTFCKVTVETTISKEELKKDPLVVSNVKCSVSPVVEGLDKMLKLNQLPLLTRIGNCVKARFIAIGDAFSRVSAPLKEKFQQLFMTEQERNLIDTFSDNVFIPSAENDN